MADFEKSSDFPEEEQPFLSQSKPPRSKSTLLYAVTAALTISLLANVLLALPTNLNKTCLAYTNLYESPITNDISVKYKSVQFNGHFFNESVYRRAPSKEVDDAWLALGVASRHYVIPENDPERYGIDPKSTKVIPEQGGGFPVLFQFEHHLHCLNLLRKSTWFNYPYYSALGQEAFSDSEHRLKLHTTHCIDMIRQALQCNADTTVYGQYWVRDSNEPFVDFNTKHKCVDFDALRDWVVRHQAPVGLQVDYRIGDTMLETTP